MTSLSRSPIGEELLDDPAADPAAVASSLRHIARANRWFGGAAAVRFGLAQTLGDMPRGTTLTLLDVGTGLGDLPRAAVRWGARHGLRIRPIGLERSRVAARLAHDAGVAMIVGCAGAPPFQDKSVDILLVSQVAHHLAPASTVELLRAADRIARRVVIVSDLRRSRVAQLAFRVGAAALRFDAVTIADGLTSIQRGYREAELRTLCERAGVRADIHRRPVSRLIVSWRPGARR
ncbi:MAG: methyltransferase domain-containing protein [Gemmatimonadales bacterium]|nr:methyltransferase domain-containing protein [Gemmatimonadales bacterium]